MVWEDGTCEYYLAGIDQDLEENLKAHGNKEVNVSCHDSRGNV